MIFPLISCLFLIVAIVCFLHLTPKQIAEDILELTVKEPTLRDQVRALRTGKQKKSIGQRLLYTQDALTAMGKENKFALVICASLVLFVVGAVLAILLGNVFLVPSFAAFLAIAPFIYVRSKPKDHGLENLIEGELQAGQKVVVVEDLISTGGSSLKAVEAIRRAGGEVVGMVASYTYGFPVAEKAFAEAGVKLLTLTNYEAVVAQALSTGYIKETDVPLLGEWRQNPAEWGK